MRETLLKKWWDSHQRVLQFCPPSEKPGWGRCKAKTSEEQSVALLDSFWSFLELEILVISNLHPRFIQRTHPFCLIGVSFLQASGINLLGSLARSWNSCSYEGEGRILPNCVSCKWIRTVRKARPQNGDCKAHINEFPMEVSHLLFRACSACRDHILSLKMSEFRMQWLFDIYLSKMANHLMIFLVLDTTISINL